MPSVRPVLIATAWQPRQVAVMMLYEEGAFLLDDPISKFVPAFAATKVATQEGTLEDLDRPITFRHLLTHTSGLTYRCGPGRVG